MSEEEAKREAERTARFNKAVDERVEVALAAKEKADAERKAKEEADRKAAEEKRRKEDDYLGVFGF